MIKSSDEMAQEVEFWRDFVDWWETKHRKPAQGRILEALAEAEYRERQATLSLIRAPRAGRFLH